MLFVVSRIKNNKNNTLGLFLNLIHKMVISRPKVY